MKRKIHPGAVILAILAFVFIHVVWFFVLGFVGFFCWEGWFTRDDLTAEQQTEIAWALGFDLAPGETLTVSYYAGFWPKTIGEDGFWGSISGVASEEEFLSRCHEETVFFWDGQYDFAKREYSYRPQFQIMDSSDAFELAAIKKVQGMVNNLILPYVVHVILWGWPAAELTLIVTRIVKRRKTKKAPHPAGDPLPDVPGQ